MTINLLLYAYAVIYNIVAFVILTYKRKTFIKRFNYSNSLIVTIWGIAGMNFCWNEEALAIRNANANNLGFLNRVTDSMIWLRMYMLIILGCLCLCLVPAICCANIRGGNETYARRLTEDRVLQARVPEVR